MGLIDALSGNTWALNKLKDQSSIPRRLSQSFNKYDCKFAFFYGLDISFQLFCTVAFEHVSRSANIFKQNIKNIQSQKADAILKTYCIYIFLMYKYSKFTDEGDYFDVADGLICPPIDVIYRPAAAEVIVH